MALTVGEIMTDGGQALPFARDLREAVALYVVKRDPALTAEALMAHCAQHLAPYKRPARIEFRDTLPKSPIGKVLHRALRDEVVSQAAL